MKKIIIFGLGDNAELAKFYFEKDSQFEVYGFTVDKNFKNKDFFCNLPVFDWDTIGTIFKPEDFLLFIAVGYNNMNITRETKFLEGKDKGFKFASYISSKSIIYSKNIGENNFILEGNIIQPFVNIGNNNVLWSGNHIGHHTMIGNNNFISSHVTIGGRVNLKNNCFLGINSTIKDHITLSNFTLVGAGSFISINTEEFGVYPNPSSKKLNINSTDIKL